MKGFFEKENIELYAYVPLKNCKIIKKYLLDKNGLDEGCGAVMMLLPYRSDAAPVNLSVYASVRDYHKYVDRRLYKQPISRCKIQALCRPFSH